MARSRYGSRRRNKDGPQKHNRSSSERYDKRRLAAESSANTRPTPPTPAQNQAVEDLLAGIGVPEQKPLKPDDFQLEALAAIENEDVLVTAPTGSGKTWIAREEIRRLLANGKRRGTQRP